MEKTIKITFEKRTDSISNIEGIDTSWMVEGKYYPTQFVNLEGSTFALLRLYKDFVGDGYHLSLSGNSKYMAMANEIDYTISVELIIENSTEIKWCDEKDGVKQVELLKGFSKDLNGIYHEVIDMANVITLDNGKFLIKDYGKYASGLCFVSDKPKFFWNEIKREDLNLGRGEYAALYGYYYVSKKGTKCFKLSSKLQATHMLLRDNWGGAFNSYRGNTLVELNHEYHRRASSNGGGTGYDYAVFPIGWRNILSEDDI